MTPTHVGRMDHDSPELLDKNFVPLKIQDFDSWNSEPEESTFHETFNRISSQTSLFRCFTRVAGCFRNVWASITA